MQRGRIRPALAVTLLALALAAVGGCESSDPVVAQSRPAEATPGPHSSSADPSPGSTRISPPAGSGEQYEKAKRLTDCMRENGVPNFPYPQPDGSFSMDQFAGMDTSALQQTFLQYCRQFSLGRH